MKDLAFLLSLVLILVMPWENTVLLPGVGTLSRIVGLVAAPVWILGVVVSGHVRRPSLYHLLAALYVAWAAVSIFWSRDPLNTAEATLTYVQLLLLVFLLWDLYDTPDRIRLGLQAYVIGAHVAVLNILFRYATDRSGATLRYTVSGANADNAGLLLALGMMIAVGLGLFITRQDRRGLLLWVNLAFVPLGFLGIALTATRAALVTTIPSLLFAAASLGRLSLMKRLAVGLIVVAGVLAIVPLIPATSVDRLLTTGPEIASGTLGGRGYIWKMGIQRFAESPVTGVGAGAFKTAVGIGNVAHNAFVSVLVELGLVGFGLFMAILGIAALQATRHPLWGRIFWLTLLVVWALAASSMTWEVKKYTWFVFTMTAASGAVQLPRTRTSRGDDSRDGASRAGSVGET